LPVALLRRKVRIAAIVAVMDVLAVISGTKSRRTAGMPIDALPELVFKKIFEIRDKIL